MAQTVDLDSTRMRLGDEKNLRVKVAKALLDQKELLEKRQVHNVALERNFGILREISEKQQQDFRIAMQHTQTVTKAHEYMKKEHETLQETHYRMSLDLDTLSKKEVEFNYALNQKVEYISKIDVLETGKIKLESQNVHNKSQIQQLESDINLYKK